MFLRVLQSAPSNPEVHAEKPDAIFSLVCKCWQSGRYRTGANSHTLRVVTEINLRITCHHKKPMQESKIYRDVGAISRSPFQMKTILSSNVDELLLETRNICKRKWTFVHFSHCQRDQELFCAVVICKSSIDIGDAIPVSRRRIKSRPPVTQLPLGVPNTDLHRFSNTTMTRKLVRNTFVWTRPIIAIWFLSQSCHEGQNPGLGVSSVAVRTILCSWVRFLKLFHKNVTVAPLVCTTVANQPCSRKRP